MTGQTAVVTGGASGIGRALAEKLAAAGAAGVVVADIDQDGAERVAESLAVPALGIGCDVSRPEAVRDLIARAEDAFERIDVFCSNAGVARPGGVDATDEEWTLAWNVNVLAHVFCARELVPRWLHQGGGHLVITASAAGLLTQIGSAPYAVSKHAAVGLAEWLAVTYGERGIRVSCLCPMGVDTPLLSEGLGGTPDDLGARVVRGAGAVLSPEQVAETVLLSIGEDRFLILPHPEVRDFFRRKGDDYDSWIRGMRRLQARFRTGAG